MQKSTIAQAIEGNSMLVFKPKMEFYGKIQINKKRWGLLYRGEKEATQGEIERISKFFNVPINQFFKQETPNLLQ